MAEGDVDGGAGRSWRTCSCSVCVELRHAERHAYEALRLAGLPHDAAYSFAGYRSDVAAVLNAVAVPKRVRHDKGQP